MGDQYGSMTIILHHVKVIVTLHTFGYYVGTLGTVELFRYVKANACNGNLVVDDNSFVALKTCWMG